ncbi:MAG: NHLP bacteriocin export ABC transporter permease/ATPase subunit [Gammaproteobacteria bacterium]|nr:NHLP bacteriocin export ABC transporter permease/ATPase subunit [Gammaproteobacteria bacterium]
MGGTPEEAIPHRQRDVWLEEPDALWIIDGAADLYVVPMEAGGRDGRPRFLVEINGGVALGQPADAAARLILRPRPATKLTRAARALAPAGGETDEEAAVGMGGLVEDWLAAVASGLTDRERHRDEDPAMPAAGEVTLEPGHRFSVAGKAPAFLLSIEGELSYGGGAAGRSVLIALPGRSIEAPAGARVEVVSAATLLTRQDWFELLQAGQGALLDLMAAGIGRLDAEERERLRRQRAYVADEFAGAVRKFSGLLDAQPKTALEAVDEEHLLFETMTVVLAAVGVEARMPAIPPGGEASSVTLGAIAKRSRVRMRPVTLRSGWHHRDNGPLLGRWGDERRPVALLRASARGYRMHDLAAGEVTLVTDAVAESVAASAMCPQPSLPDTPLKLVDVLTFGLGQVRRDLVTAVVASIGVGVLGLALPLANMYLFDDVIPASNRGRMLEVGAALAILAVAIAVMAYVRDVALLRVHGRLGAGFAGAVWDRLLRLPQQFFVDYAAGDIASRVKALQTIRDVLATELVVAATGVLIALFSLALMFYFAPLVAAAVLALFAVLIGISVWLGRASYQAILQGEAMSGNIFGLVLELVTSIQKLRLAGAEDRAFARWGFLYANLRDRLLRSTRLKNRHQVVIAGYSVLSLTLVFAVMLAALAGTGVEGLTTGEFLAFLAAFLTFQAVSVQVSRAVVSGYGLIPLYTRAKPILEAEPEPAAEGDPPGRLTGAVELGSVGFAYGPDLPPVIHHLSLSIRPGEFLAIVGPSGSGKSTLLKLLLGFVSPTAGSIFYDDQNLDDLDVEEVRRQIGVVLQSDRLTPGSLYEMICGATSASLDDVWKAARLAGVASDIEAMPMGMHTVITEGSSTLSGGQVQRLLIARALVAEPCLLFFDEATSALDNRTQAEVQRSLESMAVTRVVIAHRLTTVRNADRIVVLEAGRIVEIGDFDELMEADGAFARLARRQLT